VKELPIAGALGEHPNDVVAVGGHLLRIGERILHLLLEAAGPPIPEEILLERHVADRRRVSIRRAAVRLADGPAVGPAEVWLVAGDTGHLAVSGETAVKKKQPSELHFRGVEGV
jgi:hypothetical protein